jgi:hypothetical protein
MKATELILEASKTLRAAAEQLQDEARTRRARGELSKLDVVHIRRQCVQPLLNAAAALLVAQDAELADQLELHIDALDGAVLGISAAVGRTTALFDLLTFGGHLASAALAIVAVVNEADPSRLADAVIELNSAMGTLSSDGDLI